MTSGPPFFDLESSTFDLGQLWEEAYPLLGLVLLVGIVAGLPLVIGMASGSAAGVFFLVIGQLILAVGTGLVLMYVVARGIQLSGV